MRISLSVPIVAIVGLCGPSTALGQTTAAAPKWELEFYGGLAVRSVPSGGTTSTLPPGETFILPGDIASKYVPSWFFGDGTVVFNKNVVALEPATGQKPIVPLDSVLWTAGSQSSHGATFGARVLRRITNSVGAELTVGYGPSKVGGGKSSTSAIEASRASFASGWAGLMAIDPLTYVGPSASATATSQGGGAGTLLVTGAITKSFPTDHGRIEPYVLAGGGIESRVGGNTYSVTLTGEYSFRIQGTVPIHDIDTVTIHWSAPTTTGVIVLGGGARWHVSKRSGVRMDVRAILGPFRETTSLDAEPGSIIGTPTGSFVQREVTPPRAPDIIFSTDPAVRRSLSVGGVNGATTFTASGWRANLSITAGWFFRF